MAAPWVGSKAGLTAGKLGSGMIALANGARLLSFRPAPQPRRAF